MRPRVTWELFLVKRKKLPGTQVSRAVIYFIIIKNFPGGQIQHWWRVLRTVAQDLFPFLSRSSPSWAPLHDNVVIDARSPMERLLEVAQRSFSFSFLLLFSEPLLSHFHWRTQLIDHVMPVPAREKEKKEENQQIEIKNIFSFSSFFFLAG